MDILGWILVIIGMGASLVGGVWILVLAFKESPLWGIGSLLCSPVSVVFVIMHWAEARKPFLIQLGGVGVVFVGSLLGGPNVMNMSGGDEETVVSEPAQPSRPREGEGGTAEEPMVLGTAEEIVRPQTAARKEISAGSESNAVPTPRPPPQKKRKNPPANSPKVAQAEPASKPAAPPPAQGPVPDPLLLPGRTVPVDIEVVRLGADDGSGLRSLDLRLTNHARRTIKQIRMTLYYLGKKGELLKEWKTSLFDPKPALTSAASIEMTQPAFFVPKFTERVAVKVDMVGFDDGTQWTP